MRKNQKSVTRSRTLARPRFPSVARLPAAAPGPWPVIFAGASLAARESGPRERYAVVSARSIRRWSIGRAIESEPPYINIFNARASERSRSLARVRTRVHLRALGRADMHTHAERRMRELCARRVIDPRMKRSRTEKRARARACAKRVASASERTR